MSTPLLPLVTLILGGILGLASSLVASSVRRRHEFQIRILDQFLEVRKQVVDAVSDLTNLDTKQQFGQDERLNHRNTVSKLFYQHYDFIPQQVLEALVLLEVCLTHPDRGPYGMSNDAIVTISDQDLGSFIENSSLFKNARIVAPIALRSSDSEVRQREAIKLHARHVLYTLNRYASIDDLLKMTKSLKKSGYGNVTHTRLSKPNQPIEPTR